MKRPLSLLLLLALFSQGCSKHHSNPGSRSGPGNVYVTGRDSSNPILWTNGQPQELDTNGGFGTQVAVSGSDVYVGGVSDENPYAMWDGPEIMGKFTYWKNGAETTIGGPGVVEGAFGIAVQGNNVYYLASALYENGAVVPLQGQGSKGFISAAQVVGNDVYIAGCDSAGDGVYWKNGVLHVFAATQSPGTFIVVSCLYVTPNGDVYAGGTDAQQGAAIWRNGVETKVLSSGGALPLTNVKAIFVSGTDVYSISRVAVFGGSSLPAYWKNGVEVNLPPGNASYGNANSIFVAGNDVYVAGTTSQGAVLWKNGVATLLAAHGEANSVVVQ
ncbi:MAG TPA: hypothetical protein VGS79_01845 [Puia sp.]|nr:hypothetical protein [Puia sp.]